MKEFSFTNRQKADEAKREVAFRRAVYPGMVVRGRLSLDQATKQMDLMRAIQMDYERLAQEEEPGLFPKS